MAVDEKKGDFKPQKQKGQKFRKDIVNHGTKRSGFPPHLTVDDLCFYRRRSNDAWARQKDNLKIEEGGFKFIKTEYKRRFKNFFDVLKSFNGKENSSIFVVQPVKPEASLKLEGIHDFQSEYKESFDRRSKERLTKPSHQIINVKQMDDEIPTRQTPSLEASEPKPVIDILHRRITKRPTNLKIEGDFQHVTEHAEKFIEFLLTKRAELLRTPTTLRPEGDMETKTETSEQFIKYENLERPQFCKKFTQLHLEGEIDMLTEKREKFVPLEIHKRPPLVKKLTNLHLEGEFTFIPEYRQEYVHYKSLERTKPALPLNHLKAGGSFENIPANEKLFDTKVHPLIPFLREPVRKTDQDRRPSRASSRSPQRISDSKRHSSVLTRFPSNPNITFTKASDSDLSRTSIYTDKLHQDYSRASGIRKESELSYMMGDGKMQTEPEYKSSYVDFPRQRPNVKKPDCHMSDLEEIQHHVTAEKKEAVIPYRIIEKIEPCVREPESKPVGRFECQPEYRKAYKDYLIRERKPPLVPKKRVLEISSVDENVEESPSDNISETAPDSASTLQESRPKSGLKLPETVKDSSSSISSVVHASPRRIKQTPTLLKPIQRDDSRFSSRQALSIRRSLTPSPVSRTRRGSGRIVTTRSRTPSPNISATASRSVPQIHELFDASDCNGLDDDEDPAFVVLRDNKALSRRSVRHNLYKEQKWMPSWNYSIE